VQGAGPQSDARRTASAIRGQSHQTRYQLNAPFQNPRHESTQEIEVTDPTHPLFGRRFMLLSVFAPLHSSGHVLVAYREHLVLSIPLLATNLAPPRPTRPTKCSVSQLIVGLSTHLW
jgi:hypothetical protein